jgi:Na+-transporting NADH:ubiquinone oxidoreductase subunit A
METHFRLRKGYNLAHSSPAPHLIELRKVSHIAILGKDYPGIKAVLRVKPGDQVVRGQVLFVDLADERICVTSPACGEVTAIERGHQRVLSRILIAIDGDRSVEFGHSLSGFEFNRQTVTERLLSSGLWTALRARPFNRIPSPDAVPRWLFVNAMSASPEAPEPQAVIDADAENFVQGLRIVSMLASTTTFVCHPPGARLPKLEDSPNLIPVTFDGPYPAGLTGTHMHHLARVGIGQEAWSIGYQEVLAIGHFFTTGQLSCDRIVSIGGDAVEQPYLARTPLGANCRELLAHESCTGMHIVTGSPFSLDQDSTKHEFLGRLDLQVSLMRDHTSTSRWQPLRYSPLTWRLPKRMQLQKRLAVEGSATGMLPSEIFDRIWPFTVPPVPLLRALLSGDTEAAERFGCLELAPEDLELCSHLCPARKNYAEALTQTLDAIRDQV